MRNNPTESELPELGDRQVLLPTLRGNRGHWWCEGIVARLVLAAVFGSVFVLVAATVVILAGQDSSWLESVSLRLLSRDVHDKGGQALLSLALIEEEIIFGRDDPAVALTMKSLSQVDQAEGRTADAESLLSRILRIREGDYLKSLKASSEGESGVKLTAYIDALLDLSDLYIKCQRYQQAYPLLQKLRELNSHNRFWRDRGLEFARQFTVYNQSAAGTKLQPFSLSLQKRPERSMQDFVRSVAREVAVVSPDKVRVKANGSLQGLLQGTGVFYMQSQRYSLAIADFQTVIDFAKYVHPSIAEHLIALDRLSVIYTLEKKYELAEDAYKRLIASIKTRTGPYESRYLSWVLQNYAGFLVDRGRLEEAGRVSDQLRELSSEQRH